MQTEYIYIYMNDVECMKVEKRIIKKIYFKGYEVEYVRREH